MAKKPRVYEEDYEDDEDNGFEEPIEEPHPGTSSRIIPWLVVMSMVIVFGTLFMVSNTIRQQQPELQAELDTISATLAVTPAPQPEEEALSGELLRVMEHSAALEPIRDQLVAGRIDWPVTMNAINNYNGAVMQITGLSQSGRQIIILGRSTDESTAMGYAQHLRDSGLFGAVTVQSITLQLPTPVPTATPNPLLTPEAFAPVATEAAPNTYADFAIVVELKTDTADEQPGQS
jgi:Tfp pilus assembly protein PilN